MGLEHPEGMCEVGTAGSGAGTGPLACFPALPVPRREISHQWLLPGHDGQWFLAAVTKAESGSACLTTKEISPRSPSSSLGWEASYKSQSVLTDKWLLKGFCYLIMKVRIASNAVIFQEIPRDIFSAICSALPATWNETVKKLSCLAQCNPGKPHKAQAAHYCVNK